MSRMFFVKHEQSEQVFLVCAETPVQAENLVVGTVAMFIGRDMTYDEFIVQELPNMVVGNVLFLSDLDECVSDTNTLGHHMLKGKVE